LGDIESLSRACSNPDESQTGGISAKQWQTTMAPEAWSSGKSHGESCVKTLSTMINISAIQQRLRQILNLIGVISKRDRNHLIFSAMVSCIAALSETASIAIGPYLLKEMTQGPIALDRWLLGGSIAMLVTLCCRVADIRLRYQATLNIQVDIAQRLLKANLLNKVADRSALNESSFLSRSTHDIINLGSVLTYIQGLISNAVLATVILAFLVLATGISSVLIGLVAISYYGVISYTTAKRVSRLGKQAIHAQQSLLQILRAQFGLAEALFAYRESETLAKPYVTTTRSYFRSQADANAIISIPKVLIDQGVLLAALIFLLYIDSQRLATQQLGGIAATALLYLFSFNKLLPSLQQIYLSLSVIGQNMPSTIAIVESLQSYGDMNRQPLAKIPPSPIQTVEIRGLELPSGMHPIYTVESGQEGLNLHLSPGLIYLIQGDSGIGKTTLLRMLAGFQSLSRGQIMMNTISVKPHLSDEWGKLVQYVAQSPFIMPGTVEDNITLSRMKPSELSDQSQSLQEILTIVQLNTLDIKTPITDFNEGVSGGQQQRIAIARALFQRPNLLLLDEALTGIDLPTRQLVLTALSTYLQKKRMFCIAVSHDPLPGVDACVVTLKQRIARPVRR
jgi:ABC-type bacteriocin/lantibiotic exporter with double-glycine peptidase domain